jgi:2-polyprenyl-3-methyl-5-hydroxy-6-metoxy-1,4-benzoquinol methylase
MLTKTEKKAKYDHYWQTRDLEKTDARSRQRSEIICRILGQRKGNLLDVGCGRGWNALYFKEKGFQVEAVDISPEAVEITKQRGITARVLDLEQDDIRGEYDVILCLEVLQFVNEPLRVLLKLESALKDKGGLILSLPNEFHFLRRLKILFGRPDLGGFNAPHLRFFYPDEIRRLLRRTGLKIVETIPVSLVPPSKGFLAAVGDLSAKLFPGLFSLYTVVKTVRREA